ncbi:MAG: hypothetical protein DLM60_16115 [Pseudonocardiales bacterium]|nr:MAG: hypothetical protein DLM60_16115 [Pseudonocardiales bacterium]
MAVLGRDAMVGDAVRVLVHGRGGERVVIVHVGADGAVEVAIASQHRAAHSCTTRATLTQSLPVEFAAAPPFDARAAYDDAPFPLGPPPAPPLPHRRRCCAVRERPMAQSRRTPSAGDLRWVLRQPEPGGASAGRAGCAAPTTSTNAGEPSLRIVAGVGEE